MATRPLRMILMSFSLLSFMKKVRLNLCNFSSFLPQGQNLSGRKGTLVLGYNLPSLSHSLSSLQYSCRTQYGVH